VGKTEGTGTNKGNKRILKNKKFNIKIQKMQIKKIIGEEINK